MVADPRKAKLDAIYKHAIDLELPDVAGVIETKIKEYAQQAGVSGTWVPNKTSNPSFPPGLVGSVMETKV